MKNIVVVISGSGSNLQALIDSIENKRIAARIRAVISNIDDVKGLERARLHNIPAIVIDHKQFPSRASFDSRLQEIIDSQAPDLVVLAGFMRILTPEFTRHFLGRMINIHPSLLPKYQGLHTHRRALEARDAEHGASVHFVTEELDGGPIILQARVPVVQDDDEERLARRVLDVEHQILPLAVRWFVEEKVVLEPDSGQVNFLGSILPPQGMDLKEAKEKAL